MLSTMRKRKGGVGVYIILGLLFIGLIGFGVGGTGALGVSNIGKVGKTPISINTYVASLNNLRQLYLRQAGQLPSHNELRASGVLDNVVDNAVRAAALDDMNRVMGISVGDDTVREEILQSDQFLNIDGTFNATSFDFFLDQQNLTASEFESVIRKSNARTLIEGAVSNAVEAPATLGEALVNYVLEARDVAWIELSEADLPEPIGDITDEMAQAFYNDNPDLFQSLETKKITYAWLTPEMVTDLDITEERLREEYEVLGARYRLPERRAVERLIYNDDAAAADAKARLDAGEVSFADLVAERGLTMNDIDLGIVERDQVEADAAAVIFETSEVGVYGPVVETLGSALYNVSAVLNAQTIPFEEVEEELRAEVGAIMRGDVINNLVPELDELLVSGASLEEVSTETTLELETMDFTVASQEGIAAYDTFREIALVATDRDFPEIYTLSDGGIFALRVDEIVPAGLMAFEDVTEEAAELARAANVRSALADLADSLENVVIEGGEPLSSLGYASSSVRDINRNVPTNDFNLETVNAIFETEEGQFTKAEVGDELFLILVEGINAPDLEDEANASIIANVTTEVSRDITNDLLLGFADAAADDAGIALDFNVIDQVNAQILGPLTEF